MPPKSRLDVKGRLTPRTSKDDARFQGSILTKRRAGPAIDPKTGKPAHSGMGIAPSNANTGSIIVSRRSNPARVDLTDEEVAARARAEKDRRDRERRAEAEMKAYMESVALATARAGADMDPDAYVAWMLEELVLQTVWKQVEVNGKIAMEAREEAADGDMGNETEEGPADGGDGTGAGKAAGASVKLGGTVRAVQASERWKRGVRKVVMGLRLSASKRTKKRMERKWLLAKQAAKLSGASAVATITSDPSIAAPRGEVGGGENAGTGKKAFDAGSVADLTRRQTLRRDMRIRYWILQFFDLVADERGLVTVDAYVNLNVALYKLLVEPFDAKAARSSAMKDWDHDRRGKPALNQSLFFDSIFELVQNWTCGEDADEYEYFLAYALSKISVPVTNAQSTISGANTASGSDGHAPIDSAQGHGGHGDEDGDEDAPTRRVLKDADEIDYSSDQGGGGGGEDGEDGGGLGRRRGGDGDGEDDADGDADADDDDDVIVFEPRSFEDDEELFPLDEESTKGKGAPADDRESGEDGTVNDVDAADGDAGGGQQPDVTAASGSGSEGGGSADADSNPGSNNGSEEATSASAAAAAADVDSEANEDGPVETSANPASEDQPAAQDDEKKIAPAPAKVKEAKPIEPVFPPPRMIAKHPVVRRVHLELLSDDTDRSAVHVEGSNFWTTKRARVIFNGQECEDCVVIGDSHVRAVVNHRKFVGTSTSSSAAANTAAQQRVARPGVVHLPPRSSVTLILDGHEAAAYHAPVAYTNRPVIHSVTAVPNVYRALLLTGTGFHTGYASNTANVASASGSGKSIAGAVGDQPSLAASERSPMECTTVVMIDGRAVPTEPRPPPRDNTLVGRGALPRPSANGDGTAQDNPGAGGELPRLERLLVRVPEGSLPLDPAARSAVTVVVFGIASDPLHRNITRMINEGPVPVPSAAPPVVTGVHDAGIAQARHTAHQSADVRGITGRSTGVVQSRDTAASHHSPGSLRLGASANPSVAPNRPPPVYTSKFWALGGGFMMRTASSASTDGSTPIGLSVVRRRRGRGQRGVQVSHEKGSMSWKWTSNGVGISEALRAKEEAERRAAEVEAARIAAEEAGDAEGDVAAMLAATAGKDGPSAGVVDPMDALPSGTNGTSPRGPRDVPPLAPSGSDMFRMMPTRTAGVLPKVRDPPASKSPRQAAAVSGIGNDTDRNTGQIEDGSYLSPRQRIQRHQHQMGHGHSHRLAPGPAQEHPLLKSGYFEHGPAHRRSQPQGRPTQGVNMRGKAGSWVLPELMDRPGFHLSHDPSRGAQRRL